MTAKRHRKSSTRSFGWLHASGLLAFLVAATAWAHQQGIINWELPAFVAGPAGAPAIPGLPSGASSKPADVPVTPARDITGIGTVAGASDANCPGQFLAGEEPALKIATLNAQTHELCYSGFAVLVSGVTRTPIWAAEHLTAGRIATARKLPRKGDFHADENLPANERAELSDYTDEGFDRGHMAPNGDMPDAASQAESYTLANIAPQIAEDNRGIWEGIEETVRNLAIKDSDIYVVSGPIFAADRAQAKTLNSRVAVPIEFFKAVYDAKHHQAAAYIVHNEKGRKYEVISLGELQTMTGLQVFPGLPVDAVVALKLPAPVVHKTS